MSYFRTLFVISMALLLMAGVGDADTLSDNWQAEARQELARLKSADPVEDAKAAIREGDLRFIGLMGYSLIVPGVDSDEYYGEYHKRYGVYVIKGTSDFIQIPEQLELINIGSPYAEKYNEILLEHIQSLP